MLTYVAMLAFAITSLCPWVSPREARQLARIIEQESDFRQIAATWLAAHVYVESRYKRDHVSKTNDHGLAQIHVAVNGSATFLGREWLLQVPRVNLREAARLADMWRGYHNRECGEPWAEEPWLNPRPSRGWPAWLYPGGMFEPSRHVYWSHMKYGYKVKNTASADLVAAIVELMALQMKLADRIHNAKRREAKTLVGMGIWDT